jgi:hypothetical protein
VVRELRKLALDAEHEQQGAGLGVRLAHHFSG